MNQKAKISQKDIVRSALKDESFLAVLPTGGGKTFTFWLPAIIKAKSYKPLTIVISPLQALMKNHSENFKIKNQNFRLGVISSYLSPIERMNTINDIKNGLIDILYLAPESLRSNVVFDSLKRRVIDRFVIDEAHCFSAWGHDFRHDYHYIAEFIKDLQQESKFQTNIAISCFTATAKPEVIKDIKDYFKDSLNIELKEYIASVKRYNLNYEAIEVKDKKEKYEKLVEILKQNPKKPTIIYIPQNARECKKLSQKLNEDERINELDLVIEPFYANLDKDIEEGRKAGRKKNEILEDFIKNRVDIVIATTAFGMGIDKSDIELIIHYEQSDSLESYLQESGRAARDEKLVAKCIVLYDKNDFLKNFYQLNSTKLEYHEIDKIVREIKKYKRDKIYVTPKSLAQRIGIDITDSKIDYEVLIKTALLELEKAKIVKRGRNKTLVFATSIDKQKRNMDYVHKVLDEKRDEYKDIYEYMIMVMQNVIQRSKTEPLHSDDLAEITGVDKKTIFDVLRALQKEGLLEYENDISIYVKKSIKRDFKKFFEIERVVFDKLKENISCQKFDLRELENIIDSKHMILSIKQIIKSWEYLSNLKRKILKNVHFHKSICHFSMDMKDLDKLENLIEIRKDISEYIIDYLLKNLGSKSEAEVEICSTKLHNHLDKGIKKISTNGFHHILVYLNDLLKGSFELRQGRLIYYQAFSLEKLPKINERTPYKKREHYNKSLKPYYIRKIEAIHIQIEFIKRLLKDGWNKTSSFISDYFRLEYKKFKRKYGFDEKKIKIPLTEEKLNEILRDLNDEQKKVFDDKDSNAILVIAGPGSGKTKLLVQKIASLITVENHKSEYFLMLAHSRVAVNEFRERLKKLISTDIKIYTFHSFALELLGKRVNDEDDLKDVVPLATKLIQNNSITLPYIQMLVLDEYQDVSKNSYEFIKTIFEKMSKDKKIIAVGDDDQCINNFGEDRADIEYIKKFSQDFNSIDEEDKFKFSQYELTYNYRSKKDIVSFANRFANRYISNRLKDRDLIPIKNENGKIEVYKYNHNYFSKLLKLLQNSSGLIAILARNNDDVLNIYSFLTQNNIKANYILSKDEFRLGNLIELQDFLHFWQNSTFNKAIEKFEKVYKDSKNFYLAKEVIKKFEIEYDDIEKYQNYYASLFEEYLMQINFEEFETFKSNIIVTTMHKSKGKEFDNVFVCIDNFLINDPYESRLLYVAITRAKKSLTIFTKDNFFDELIEVKRINDKPFEQKELIFIMGLRDIHLTNKFSYMGIQKVNLISGEEIEIAKKDSGIFMYKEGIQIGKLSKNMVSKLNKYFDKYKLNNKAEIEYIVCYKDKSGEIFKEPLAKISLIIK